MPWWAVARTANGGRREGIEGIEVPGRVGCLDGGDADHVQVGALLEPALPPARGWLQG
jgi:hypothetical protein